MLTIKVKVESDEKIHFYKFENKQTVNEQVHDFLDKLNYQEPENRIFFALFNPASAMYMNTCEEIQTCN